MSLGRILLAMVDRPAQAMAAVTTRPRSWWLPAVLILASVVALTAVSAPETIAMTNERQAQVLEPIIASLPEEQAELVMQRSQMTLRRLMLSAVLGGGAVMAIGWLARGSGGHRAPVGAGHGRQERLGRHFCGGRRLEYAP